MRPDAWNADDKPTVALLAKPGLEKWNHFFTRSGTQMSAKQKVEKRLTVVRNKAVDMLKSALTVRAQAEEKARQEAEALDGKRDEPKPTPQPEPEAIPSTDDNKFKVRTIQEAYDRNVCTYNVTGKQFYVQKWLGCRTCGMVGNAGVCLSCARTCHNGHEYVDDDYCTIEMRCEHDWM